MRPRNNTSALITEIRGLSPLAEKSWMARFGFGESLAAGGAEADEAVFSGVASRSVRLARAGGVFPEFLMLVFADDSLTGSLAF